MELMFLNGDSACCDTVQTKKETPDNGDSSGVEDKDTGNNNDGSASESRPITHNHKKKK